MSWKEDMYEAIRAYLNLPGEILDVSESASQNIGCDTCGPDTTYEVDIVYLSNGQRKYHFYYGSFTDLINAIT